MRFAVVSDPHAEQHFDWSVTVFGRLSRNDLDFVACLGDWTSSPGDSWDRFVAPLLAPIRCPILGCRGNHDDIEKWKSWFNLPLEYTKVFDNNLCVFLDNNSWNTNKLDWLDKELSKPANRRFVFVHQLPRTSKWKPNSTFDYEGFCHVVSKHKVDACFCGHIHAFDIEEILGIRYYLTGGGGGERYNVAFPVRQVSNHYLLVEVGEKVEVTLCQQHRLREELHKL